MGVEGGFSFQASNLGFEYSNTGTTWMTVTVLISLPAGLYSF
jgi:hypothetical protein